MVKPTQYLILANNKRMIENLQGVGMRDELLAAEPNSGPSPEYLIIVVIIVT